MELSPTPDKLELLTTDELKEIKEELWKRTHYTKTVNGRVTIDTQKEQEFEDNLTNQTENFYRSSVNTTTKDDLDKILINKYKDIKILLNDDPGFNAKIISKRRRLANHIYNLIQSKLPEIDSEYTKKKKLCDDKIKEYNEFLPVLYKSEPTISIIQPNRNREYNENTLKTEALFKEIEKLKKEKKEAAENLDSINKDIDELEDNWRDIFKLMPIYKKTINSLSTPATLGGKRKTRRNRKSKKSKKRKSYKKRI
jgi:hypothetical protein